MVAGCFGLGVEGDWLTVLRVGGEGGGGGGVGLVGWPKVEGD